VPTLADGCELDIVAFLLDDAEQVTTDEDLVFWTRRSVRTAR
jgi:stress response protein SCP2